MMSNMKRQQARKPAVLLDPPALAEADLPSPAARAAKLAAFDELVAAMQAAADDPAYVAGDPAAVAAFEKAFAYAWIESGSLLTEEDYRIAMLPRLRRR